MVSRLLSRAELIDECEVILQDGSNATWTAAELGTFLDRVLVRASSMVPYVMYDPYTMETRTGSATSTSANNLVDASNAQFTSSDTGKTVYNVTDKTWAVITSYSSTSQVGLSKDIFTSGETYEIYNTGCFAKNQINIADSDDYLDIIGAIYPITPEYQGLGYQNMRNVNMLSYKIAEIDVAHIDDSAETTAYKDVHLYVARQHKVCELADLAAAVNNGSGYSAGDTSMVLDALGSDSTIYKDSLFTVALASGIDSKYTYRVTADATITTNAATISFFPGLEAAVSDNAVVTFVKSTLTTELQDIIITYVCGLAMASEGVRLINAIPIGGVNASREYAVTGGEWIKEAQTKLKALIDIDQRANHIYSRS